MEEYKSAEEEKAAKRAAKSTGEKIMNFFTEDGRQQKHKTDEELLADDFDALMAEIDPETGEGGRLSQIELECEEEDNDEGYPDCQALLGRIFLDPKLSNV